VSSLEKPALEEPKRDASTPLVTIVVPTRDRSEHLLRAVCALLAADRDDVEIVVVDQSTDDSTSAALTELDGRANFLYVKSPGTGSALARNLGISKARAEIVGLTDDDCEVSPDWMDELVASFEADDRIAVVFGSVDAAAHDPDAGFIPAHGGSNESLARNLREMHRVDGMAACMGVRRSAWQALGGFDTALGSGARLRSAAEGDLALRALGEGWFVASNPRLAAVHHGFRTWEQGRELIFSYWYGTGAMLAKPLKRGQVAVCPLLARLAWRWAFGRSPVAASLGSRPHRLFRLGAFARGFAAGALTPIDRASGHYAPR
jgi:glycosyltransferase involved in cell wall biosynthesis